mmetsp:Transcript_559/g.2225  ORF Transcript_559/g.2225 Transcript_559/m.2225 type:complete len:445 (-) Transcript_559:46-1380(-)
MEHQPPPLRANMRALAAATATRPLDQPCAPPSPALRGGRTPCARSRLGQTGFHKPLEHRLLGSVQIRDALLGKPGVVQDVGRHSARLGLLSKHGAKAVDARVAQPASPALLRQGHRAVEHEVDVADCGGALAVGVLAKSRLEQQQSQAPRVGRVAILLRRHALGAEVLERADEGASEHGRGELSGQTKVRQHHAAVGVDEDVPALDVAVNAPLDHEVAQAEASLEADAGQCALGHSASLGDDGVEAADVHVLQGHEHLPLAVGGAVEADEALTVAGEERGELAKELVPLGPLINLHGLEGHEAAGAALARKPNCGGRPGSQNAKRRQVPEVHHVTHRVRPRKHRGVALGDSRHAEAHLAIARHAQLADSEGVVCHREIGARADAHRWLLCRALQELSLGKDARLVGGAERRPGVRVLHHHGERRRLAGLLLASGSPRSGGGSHG